MYRCAICHFEMELDDVAVEVGNGRGVCLHCYARETSTQRPMPSTLRQTLHVMLAGLSVGLRSTGGRQQGSRYCCAICHFGMELDDVAVEVGNGRGVCLRCYARETSTQRPMPNTLRRALQVTLAGFSVR
jgi:ribosomal protein L40E